MTTNQFPKKQPQIAQMECVFNAPSHKDMQVDLFADLVTCTYNYDHKLVWVKEHVAFYYLQTGTGSEITDWRRSISRATILRYNFEEAYQKDEVVYYAGKMYAAKDVVPKYNSPLDHEELWYCISGETATVRYLFRDISATIIYTEIRNPIFQVFLGEFVYDAEGNIAIDPNTGLSILENMQMVDVPIIERTDLPKDNGTAYELAFFENCAESEQLFSGCVNIK